MENFDGALNSDLDSLGTAVYNSLGNVTEGVSAVDRLLTIQEICELLKVSKTYIYWLTHQRKIPHIKMQGHLRFRESAINSWLESQEVC